ncbi:MAG TPA: outer membrane beta-barrel protein [Chlorobaculum sp.]|nr:outer membrane beta-barrel protein [Chlorobaculum sp.]
MKKILISLLVAAGCSIPALAQATTPYVSVSAGLGSMNKSGINGESNVVDFNSGFAFNGAVGLEGENARVELAVCHQTNDVETIYGISPGKYGLNLNFSVGTLMANGYVDIPVKNEGIAPYLMAGVGLADVNAKFSENISSGISASFSNTVFSWQIGAGVGVKAADNVTVDLGYRYFSPSEFTVFDIKHSLSSSNFLTGIRYSF